MGEEIMGTVRTTSGKTNEIRQIDLRTTVQGGN